MSRTLAPCGTTAARKRHRKHGETCETCQPTPHPNQTPKPCGTPAAWRRHRKHNETPCAPCREAIRIHNAERRRKTRERNPPANPNNPIPIDALIEEITFLLNSGEGTARILQATGYTCREKALRDRLDNNGHKHLIPRIFTPWELAA